MDDVRLPEFEAGDGEDARSYGRTSPQSGRVEFINRMREMGRPNSVRIA